MRKWTPTINGNGWGSPSVENGKRRRALAPFSALDTDSRLFFERIVSVKKIRDFVFITKANARGR